MRCKGSGISWSCYGEEVLLTEDRCFNYMSYNAFTLLAKQNLGGIKPNQACVPRVRETLLTEPSNMHKEVVTITEILANGLSKSHEQEKAYDTKLSIVDPDH